MGDTFENVSRREFYVYCGILLRMACEKDEHQPVTKLWSNGSPCYSATMSRSRFQVLNKCVRFDDKTTRLARIEGHEGKLAPIYSFLQYLGNKFMEAYEPGLVVTVDERLTSFHGRCSFKDAMRGKPDPEGLKIWVLNDASNSYLWNFDVC